MLRMIMFGLIQTLFFAFLLKSYLNLSWAVTLITLVSIFGLLFSRVWYLVKEQKSSESP